MAAAHVFPLSEAVPAEDRLRLERQQAVESVLGTMGGEGELPSAETIALMERYVDGQMTMNELAEAIFAKARG